MINGTAYTILLMLLWASGECSRELNENLIPYDCYSQGADHKFFTSRNAKIIYPAIPTRYTKLDLA